MRRSSRHNDEPGLIYYVLDANRLVQRVKIGFTTSLGARLNELKAQTFGRQQPLLLALEEGNRRDEEQRHQTFKRLWLHGEWFQYQDELAEHIRGLEQPFAFINDRPGLWYYAGGWHGFSGWANVQFGSPAVSEPDEDDRSLGIPAPIDF